MKDSLYRYLLMLGDNSMILGHRLSELCGHGPSLETDIALTNLSLDLFGQVRNIFQYAAELEGGNATEDTVAHDRTAREFYSCILVEQPNTDFGHVIARQFLFDLFQKIQLEQLCKSSDERIRAIAIKSLKETKYHLRFSSEWVRRLGDGTQESHERIQEAFDHLVPFVHELMEESDVEREMRVAGIGHDVEQIKAEYYPALERLLDEATLAMPETKDRFAQGKSGMHTEMMDYILQEFQYMQRTYPGMQW